MAKMLLQLTNQVTKKTYEFEVEELNTSRNYYNFNIELEEGMDDGEYKYILYDEFGVGVSDGTLQIGDYIENKIDYKQENNGYIQYKG